MAALPSPTQVAGIHNAIYEAYFHQVDPSNQGSIGAVEAARFLKRSGLSDAILSRIWDLSDPAGKGYLNKPGFFVALKLVSLAQAGKEVNMVNMMLDTPPPNMGDAAPIVSVPNSIVSPPMISTSLISTSDWAVKPAERAKYDSLFDSLQPLNGMIPGNKVKGLLMESKLPLDTLGKIWDLADQDKDGMLDRHEFMVAMHLVYKALEKYTIPSVLPPELMPPAKRKDSVPVSVNLPGSIPAPAVIPNAVPILPNLVMGIDGTKPAPPAIPPLPVVPWVVSTDEKTKYDILFHQTDIDKDGFVSGLEIKDVFLKSGVPQAVLAHIWSLCDIKQSGKLNSEQFALAMWLINQKLQGNEPPPSLTPEMLPPSFRTKPTADGLIENTSAPYSNPELDMITKEIEELQKEKHILETDIAQKEADIQIKNGEIKSLQSELDTLAATLKQLENQKGEAQKRLTDLKTQSSALQTELNDMKVALEEGQVQVDNLRRQAEEQEQTLKTQEEELISKKQELEDLKQEEANLEKMQSETKNHLESLTKNLQDTQLQISQAKAKITDLQEQHRQMKDAITVFDNALTTGDATTVTDSLFNISPEFRDEEYTRFALVNGKSPTETNKKDPFSNSHVSPSTNTPGYVQNDVYSEDPFKSTKSNMPASSDPFAPNDPFSSAFTPQPVSGFVADPFSAFDAAGNSGKRDPFDPFGDSGRGNSKTPVDVNSADKDPFGCDPFALQPSSGGPPPRPESPSPALPPKKQKQPPPRPAPPRPAQPTMRAAPVPPTPSPDPFGDAFGNNTSSPVDAFSNSIGNSDAFADFSNFENKFCNSSAGSSSSTVRSTSDSPALSDAKKGTSQPRYASMEFTEDPFRDYRYEDPFEIADPFAEEDKQESDVTMKKDSSNKLDSFGFDTNSSASKINRKHSPNLNGKILNDPFALGLGKKESKSVPPEDQQLAWAAAESLRLEDERRRRLKQEQEDLEYALALSRAEGKK